MLGDSPSDVRWLNDAEQALVKDNLLAEEKTKPTSHLDGMRGALANRASIWRRLCISP
jgi:hypothetical protein